MRVFQLNTFCGVKSTGRIALEIAKLVKADGGECRIGYGVPESCAEAEPFGYRIGTPLERKVHGAMRKLLDAEGMGSRAATKLLIDEMERFAPQLVHFHNLHGCYLHLPTLFHYLSQSKVPVVWTLHDCWPFTGHCAYFDYAGCNRWQSGCHHCPQQRSYPACIGLDGSKRNYTMKKALFTSLDDLTFVAPCKWMTIPLKASYLGRYPVRVIPNGVNMSVFKPTASDLHTRYALGKKRVVLSVASEWDERKGLRYLIEAAKRLGSGYRFVVIGLSARQIETLPSGMIGIEHTANTTELAAWYTLADCLANPTMEDNMPMVNLEALACGTPVAVFETGGCPEAVDQTCGQTVAKGDVEGLCQAIEALCAHKSKLTVNCRERAERLFDCETTFRAYVDLYKELCR